MVIIGLDESLNNDQSGWPKKNPLIGPKSEMKEVFNGIKEF